MKWNRIFGSVNRLVTMAYQGYGDRLTRLLDHRIVELLDSGFSRSQLVDTIDDTTSLGRQLTYLRFKR